MRNEMCPVTTNHHLCSIFVHLVGYEGGKHDKIEGGI